MDTIIEPLSQDYPIHSREKNSLKQFGVKLEL